MFEVWAFRTLAPRDFTLDEHRGQARKPVTVMIHMFLLSWMLPTPYITANESTQAARFVAERRHVETSRRTCS